jgi:hypothetical protein
VTWLKRNLLALIVIVVTLPILAFVLVGYPLLERGTAPIQTVKQGDTIELAGYSFTLTKSAEFVGTGTGAGTNNIPVGSSIVAAVFEVEPGADAADDGFCDAELTSRSGGTDRAWRVVSSPSDFDYAVGDERTTSCLFEGEAFELETVFLAPTGVYDSATVDVTVESTTYRFELVHE